MTPTSTHGLKYKSKNNMGKTFGDAVVLARSQSEHNPIMGVLVLLPQLLPMTIDIHLAP